MASTMISFVFSRAICRNLFKNLRQRYFSPVAFISDKATNKSSPIESIIDSLDSIVNIQGTQASSLPQDNKSEEQSFARMLRDSRFIQLGDLRNKMVAGIIIDVVQDDLYIDFGGKFLCVCPRPSFEAERYIVNQRVKLTLHKFEMSSAFMGSSKHVTLLEADASCSGLYEPFRRGKNKEINEGLIDSENVKESLKSEAIDEVAGDEGKVLNATSESQNVEKIVGGEKKVSMENMVDKLLDPSKVGKQDDEHVNESDNKTRER